MEPNNRVLLPELLEKSVIKANQDVIRTSLIGLDVAIHSNAVQCLLHAEKHGDTSLMRRLLVDIVDDKSGYRRQGLIAWMRRFSPMELKGDVIKLSGTINGVPIPFDCKLANETPFTKIPEFAEVVQWKPIYKGGVVGQIERAMKAYKASVENTKIENGRVVGPIDPKKPYYSGIHLDKMDNTFEKIESAVKEFETFNDDTAETEAMRKQRAEADKYLTSKDETAKGPASQLVTADEGDKA